MRTKAAPLWKRIGRWAVLAGLIALVLGIVLRDIGVSGGPVAGEAGVRWGGRLAVAGLLLAATGLAVNARDIWSVLHRRRTGEQVHFAVTAGLSLLLAAALCYITARRHVRIDWRTQRMRPLHRRTEELLLGLERPVSATIVHRTLRFPDDRAWLPVMDMTRKLLGRFEALNPSFSVEDLNWTRAENRQRLQELVAGLELPGGQLPKLCVVFESGERSQVVPFERLVRSTEGALAAPDQFWGETAFAWATAKVAKGEAAAAALQAAIGPRRLQFIQMSDAQVVAARYLFIGGLPGLFVVVGVAVWVSRRR